MTRSDPSSASDSSRENGARGLIECLCFIRWSLHPTVAEVRAAVETVVAARRTLGRAVGFVVVVDPAAQVPSPAVAFEMMRTVPIIERAIECGVAIVPGNSLHVRALRGTVTAVGSLFHSGWDLCADQDDALGRLCRRFGLDFDAVRAEALERGFLLTVSQLEGG